MLELVFSDFWHWLGFTIDLLIICHVADNCNKYILERALLHHEEATKKRN